MSPETPHLVVQPRTGEDLVPAIEDLLRRVTGAEPHESRLIESDEVRRRADLAFTDGIGRGTVIAALGPYRGALRLDIWIEHNRVFASPAGEPTETSCYLNDFRASWTAPEEAPDTLPEDFVRSVVAGIGAARDAVRRANRRSSSPWFQVEVVARP